MGLCRPSAGFQQLSRKLEVAWNVGWVERSETHPTKTSGLTTSLRAKRSNPSLRVCRSLDCFVAALLAMTRREREKTSGVGNMAAVLPVERHHRRLCGQGRGRHDHDADIHRQHHLLWDNRRARALQVHEVSSLTHLARALDKTDSLTDTISRLARFSRLKLAHCKMFHSSPLSANLD